MEQLSLTDLLHAMCDSPWALSEASRALEMSRSWPAANELGQCWQNPAFPWPPWAQHSVVTGLWCHIEVHPTVLLMFLCNFRDFLTLCKWTENPGAHSLMLGEPSTQHSQMTTRELQARQKGKVTTTSNPEID